MKRVCTLLLFSVVLFPFSVAAETEFQPAFPEDVSGFLEKESNCYVMEEQPEVETDSYTPPAETPEEKCDWKKLKAEREALLEKYQDSPLVEQTIRHYNSESWEYDFNARYAREPE